MSESEKMEIWLRITFSNIRREEVRFEQLRWIDVCCVIVRPVGGDELLQSSRKGMVELSGGEDEVELERYAR